MNARRARESDLPEIIRLARKDNLDYKGMGSDDFWIGEEGGKIVAMAGLKRHPDGVELCSVAVEENHRNRGLGGQLLNTILEDFKGEIYLATIIPSFFEKFGFAPIESFPPSMVRKQEWCDGCRTELCTIMIRKSG